MYIMVACDLIEIIYFSIDFLRMVYQKYFLKTKWLEG